MCLPCLLRTAWMLGLASLFMEMSSECIHAVFLIYLTTTLGLSVMTVGIVEGIAEATAGMRQALDTVGAFAGPLLAMLMLYTYLHDLRLVMWVAVIPAVICVVLIIWVIPIQEPEHSTERTAKLRLPWRDTKQLSLAYWLLLGLTALVTLARMTGAFLVLRA